MQTCANNGLLRTAVDASRDQGCRIAFVPTMGNLHAGHLHLMAQAQSMADCVVASIYVNPTQFGPAEDFDAYPRTLQADTQKLIDQGVDILYTPSQADVYPRGLESVQVIDPGPIASRLCGASRPGHFAGVATVVLRLFDLVQPDVALFGHKDFQQLRVIERVTQAANIDIDIVGVDTVREYDGLALSSRNQYLTDAERARAPALYAVLRQAANDWARGAAVEEMESRGRMQLGKAGFELEYFSVCRPGDLERATADDNEAIILVAARLGRARLIDNLIVSR